MEWSEDDIFKGNIEITTKIGCSNMCEYCPQMKLIKKYQSPARMMTLENFKKYTKDIPPSLNFHFTGYVEPFDNPIAHELILWGHELGHKLRISTTLEGLSKNQYHAIRDIPWDDFSIHLPSSSYNERIGIGSTKDLHECGRPKLREDWLEMLDYVCSNKPRGRFTAHPHGGCHPQAIPVLKKNNVPVKDMKLTTRAQNTDDEKELRKKREESSNKKKKLPPGQNIRGKCARVYQPVLLPDGKLALCCADYGLKHVFGDLSKQTWSEYRHSEQFKHLVRHGADLCDFCDFGVVYQGK